MSRKVDWAFIVLRVGMGVFFIFEGLEKVSWLGSSEPLASALRRWMETATPAGRWYLETIAIPGAPVFARLVFFGEIATGLSFLTGKMTRIAAIPAIVMVVNFYVAHSQIFSYAFLSQGDGLPVLGSLTAIALNSKNK